jgi:hypothetical protein
MASHSRPQTRRRSGVAAIAEAAVIVAVSVISAATTVGLAPSAHADSYYGFQSPSGNIDCAVGVLNNGGFAGCEVRDHTWAAPPRPPVCEGGWGDRIWMDQGSTPVLGCHTDTLRANGLQTLHYGETYSAATISCDSEPSGITCTDASTGHFFRIARDSYELH